MGCPSSYTSVSFRHDLGQSRPRYLHQSGNHNQDTVCGGRLNVHVFLRVGDDMLHLICEGEVLPESTAVATMERFARTLNFSTMASIPCTA
jgi:hypothetical protein